MKRPPGLSAYIVLGSVPKATTTTTHEHTPFKLRLVPVTRFAVDENGLAIFLARRVRAVLICSCGATASFTDDDSLYDLKRGGVVRGWSATPRRRR